jgi:hypothetical protein
MIDTRFRWRGFGNGFGTWESLCRLRIYETPEQAVVIATELPENTGTSITNAVESLAMMVVEQYELRPHTLVWIEHYPAHRDLPETFARVQLAWEGQRFYAPRWRHLEPVALAQLIGQSM